MCYKDPESSFFHLIPKGHGFENSDSPMNDRMFAVKFLNGISNDDLSALCKIFQDNVSDETLEKILDGFPMMLQEERKKLLKWYGYAAERNSDVEAILYLKTAFLSKSLPVDRDNQIEILNALLADQGTLFTSNDKHYRHKQINSELISALLPLFNHAPKRRQLYDDLCVWQKRGINEPEQTIHKALLDKIYRLSTMNCHQKLRAWIERHHFDDDPGSPANLIFLKQMLPDYGNQINSQLSYTFFRYILPEYVHTVSRADDKKHRPDRLSVTVDRDAARLFATYKARLHQLEALQKEFDLNLKPILTPSAIPKVWSFSNATNSSEFEALIASAIHTFFTNGGTPLKNDSKNYVARRIHWAMDKLEQHTISNCLRPVYFLHMVISCNRKISSGEELELSSIEGPWFDRRKNTSKQRFTQLILLESLCEIFSVVKEDRVPSWQQFLYWQGKTIKSGEEVQFWRRQLEDKYEMLPVIGFQLCCLDYLQNCLPMDLSGLSYNTGGNFGSGFSLHLGGYHQFWQDNYKKIQKQAKLLSEKHPVYVKEYKMLWNAHPKKYFYERKSWLDILLNGKIEVNLDMFQGASMYDPAELKRLILETELRICVNKEARLILAKNCKRVYGLSEGLFEGVLL